MDTPLGMDALQPDGPVTRWSRVVRLPFRRRAAPAMVGAALCLALLAAEPREPASAETQPLTPAVLPGSTYQPLTPTPTPTRPVITLPTATPRAPLVPVPAPPPGARPGASPAVTVPGRAPAQVPAQAPSGQVPAPAGQRGLASAPPLPTLPALAPAGPTGTVRPAPAALPAVGTAAPGAGSAAGAGIGSVLVVLGALLRRRGGRPEIEDDSTSADRSSSSD